MGRLECNVGGFWKGFPGRKNSMNKGRKAWQGTYMALLISPSSLGALQGWASQNWAQRGW